MVKEKIRLNTGEYIEIHIKNVCSDDLCDYLRRQYVELPDLCCECKFAHDLNIKLYSCDDDMEDIVYCDKHECICKAERPACDWAATDVE